MFYEEEQQKKTVDALDRDQIVWMILEHFMIRDTDGTVLDLHSRHLETGAQERRIAVLRYSVG